MKSRVITSVAASFAIASLAVAAATAGSPQAKGQISIAAGSTGGLAFASEEVQSSGAVVDTFRSGTATVKVIGTPGSSVRFDQVTDAKTGKTTATVHLLGKDRPKTQADANAYAASGRSTVKDLIALGVPPAEAQAQFGDMDVMDSAGVYTGSAQLASAAGVNLPPAPAANVSNTVPYDVQCIDLSYESGKINGRGCSTIYLVAASGGDWWLNSKYKLTVHSSDGSIFRPVRLFEAGWGLHWAANNVVYDWDPDSTINKSSCTSTTASLSAHGFGISISGNVCPSKISPWNLTGLSSGSIWQGFEHDTDYEAAVGVQADHSPTNASAGHDSPFTLTWAPCC